MNRWLQRATGIGFAWLCTVVFVFAEPEGVEYKIKIKGASDNSVERSIKNTARSVKMRKRPPSTEGQLRRRIEKDIPLIEAILESSGYYDGTVAFDIDTARDPMRVTLRVELGEQYRFRNVEVRFVGDPDEKLDKIKPVVRRKQKVVAANVFEEQKSIIQQLNRRGYPFAVLNRREITVDREAKVVDLLLEFDQRQLSFFGPAQIEGLETLPSKYIDRQIPWKTGARYDSQLVRDFETSLLGTGQFGSARVEPEEAASNTNSIPIRIRLNERSLRTIRLGVNYSDVGPGAKVFWENRNIFGGGERFETSLEGSPIELIWDSKLTRAGFLDANQSLVLNLELSYETPDAYESKKVKGSAMVLRDFTPKIQGGVGAGYNYSLVEQFGDEDEYSYVFFPLQVDLDFRNDRLNPVKGRQFFGLTSWNQDTMGTENYLKSYVEGRDYHLLWDRYRLSTAVRLALGSIDGTSIESVPADERYYAGGGGSIRGYEYQQVGPKLDGTPTGGNKLLEFSAELRLQPGRRLGYVLFVDGGTVYNDLVEESMNDLMRYGAGVGVRWFTPIGPLRFDLAYPLNPDSTQADRLQFYISLGQAF
ncbi:BamA/TamA family outer membrane protein [Pontiellaceae bacterium B1224]|nr:BamA/TamA family outer membrane protein [Pontiellaceae bacterium B1224]